jgi:hypothetical protein
VGDTVRKHALVSGLAILIGSSPAWAQEPARLDKVRVTLPQCSELPFDAAQLNDLVEVELRAAGIEKFDTSQGATSPVNEPTALVVLGVRDCSVNAGEIELRLVEPGSGKSAVRSMPIADISVELRPRAIAIGIIEMINASWKDIAPRPVDPPAVQAPAESAPVATLRAVGTTTAGEPARDAGSGDQARPAEGVRTGVAVNLGAWNFPSRSTTLLGPGAAVGLRSGSFRGSLGGHAAFGETVTSMGSVDVRWMSGYVGAGLQGSGTLSAMLEPRLYLGYAWAQGNPGAPQVEGSTEGRLIVAAMLAGGVRNALSESWDLLADLELGAALRGVSFLSDAEPAAGLSGLILGARVGVELNPDP